MPLARQVPQSSPGSRRMRGLIASSPAPSAKEQPGITAANARMSRRTGRRKTAAAYRTMSIVPPFEVVAYGVLP